MRINRRVLKGCHRSVFRKMMIAYIAYDLVSKSMTTSINKEGHCDWGEESPSPVVLGTQNHNPQSRTNKVSLKGY